MHLQNIYNIYKEDLTLNNLQLLIFYKTKQDKIND